MVTRVLLVAGAVGVTRAVGCGPSYDLASLYPLYAESDLVRAPELLGAWTEGTGKRIWVFSPAEKGASAMVLAIADSAEAVAFTDTAALSVAGDNGDPVAESDLGGATLARGALLAPWVLPLVADSPLVLDNAGVRPLFGALLGRVGRHLVMDLSGALPAEETVSDGVSPKGLMLRLPIHWFWRVSVDGDRLQVAALDGWRLRQQMDSGRVALGTLTLGDSSDGVKLLAASTPELQRFMLEYGADPEAWSEPLFLYRWPLKRSPILGSGRVPAGGVTRAVAGAWGCDFATVGNGRLSSRRAEELLAGFREATDTGGQRRQGRAGEVTVCDILAAFGTPVRTDSVLAGGALSGVTWWYHDPLTNRMLRVNLGQAGSGWSPIEVRESDRRTLEFSPPVPALHLAAAQGRRMAAERLLARGADIHARGDTGRTALHVAAAAGHLDLVQLLLDKGADLLAVDQDSQTALHLAATQGHSDVVEFLLASGANPGAMDKGRRTALHLAASSGHVEVVRRLLTRGADASASSLYGTALSLAASEGHLSIVRLLLDNGVSPKAAPGQWTPLHAVSRWSDDGAVAETLLARGADVNAKTHFTDSGTTALHIAAELGHRDVVEALLAAGADVRARTARGTTALRLAVEHGHREVAAALMAGGADLESEEQKGSALLLSAVSSGHQAVVELLLAKGANPNAKSPDGEPALLKAASSGNATMVELLLGRGAKLDVTTTPGHTALHLAALKGKAHTVELLLARGASLTTRTRRDWTPLHAAAFGGDSVVVALLLARGADVHTADADGFTPLHLAALRGHRAAVELLLAGGANPGAKTNDGSTPLALAILGRHQAVVELFQLRR